MRFSILFLSLLFLVSCESKKKRETAPTPTSPISVEAITPSSPQSGDVSITYNLIDDRTPSVNADIKVYYSANGSGFRPATEGVGGDGTTNLPTSASPGSPHVFIWDSFADLGIGVFSVVIRIVPYETGTNDMGYKGETVAFEVVNAEASVIVQTRVFDPKMSDGLTTEIVYRVEPTGVDFEVTVKVMSVSLGLEVRRLVDAQTKAGGTDFIVQWDGKNDDGKFVDTGEYKIVVEAIYQSLPVWSDEQSVYIVRLGIVGIHFKDNGVAENEYQLMFHIRNTTKYTYYAIPDDRPEWAMGKESGDVSDLDLNTGLPRPLPAVWTNLNSPPQDSSDPAGVEDDNYNLPVCYKRATTPKFEVTLGSSAASNVTPNTAIGCGYPLTGIPIRVLVDGATPETAGGNENISPGGKVTFIATSPLPDEIKKNTLNYTIRFEYQEGGIWYQIPGSIVTEHTVYTIYDKPMLTEDPTPTPPYLPWVRCVDMVCGWVNGAATLEQLCSIITDRVNTYFGLQYETSMGASGYTGGYPNNHTILMSDFIEDYDASSFTEVNCSDCACLVSTFANHIGVDHKYLILGYTTGNIPLNYQKPIGRDWMIPFYGYFKYHAVATKDNGATISDACCVLDNDGDPSSPPHTPLLPVNLPYNTYNTLLSWDPSQYSTYGIWRCKQQ